MAVLALALVGLVIAQPPVSATGLPTVTGTVKVDVAGTLTPVGAGYQVNLMGLTPNSRSFLSGVQTDASGIFSATVDLAAYTSVRMTLVGHGDDVYGDTAYTLSPSGTYTDPTQTWELKAANVVGMVMDIADPTTNPPTAATALASASIEVDALNGSGVSTGNIASLSSGSAPGGTDGYFKLYVDWSANPNGVRMIVGPAWNAASRGAAKAYAIASPGSGSVASPTDFLLSAPNISGTLLDSDGALMKGASACFAEALQSGNTPIGCVQSDPYTAVFKYTLDFTRYASVTLQVPPPPTAKGAQTEWSLTKAAFDTNAAVYVGKDWKLDAPTISGIVKDSDGTVLPGASVQVMELDPNDNQMAYLGGTSANSANATTPGYFKLAVDFAAHPRVRLTVGPPYNGTAKGAPTSFVLTQGSLDQTYQLVAPNITGTVRDNGDPLPTAQWNLQEVTADGAYVGWLASGQADASGVVKATVNFTLHPHVKLIVGPPYGNSSTVGVETSFLLAADALDQTWNLQVPNVTGQVLDSEGQPLGLGQVNVMALDGAGWMTQNLSSGQTGQDGRFRVAVPAALLGQGGNGIAIQAMVPTGYTGRSVLTSKKYIPTANSAVTVTGVQITLDSANAAVVVTGAGDQPLMGSWVNVRSMSDAYPVDGPTNAAGVVFMSLPNVTHDQILALDFDIQAQAPWNARNDYANVNVTGRFTQDVGLGLPVFRLKLQSPNVRLIATADGSAAGSPLSNAGIEVRGVTDPSKWTWTSAEANGKSNLNLDDGDYQLTLRPPWNATGAILGERTYSVTVAGGSVTSFLDGSTPVEPDPTSTRFAITASQPTMSLLVTGGGNAVGNGFVEIVDTVKDRWLNGTQVRGDGKAGLVLADGTYRITAMAPWANSTYSSAAPCNVTVVGGAVTTTTCGTPIGGLYERALRTPNFVVTVKDPTGATPMANASLCVMNDRSWQCSNSAGNGKASLFVGGNGDIEYEVSPPWGSSGYATTRGTVTRAAITDGDYSPANAPIVRLASPNLFVTVETDTGALAIDGWVSVIENTPGGDWNYVAGGSTGLTGAASLSLPSLNGDYCLQVWPGWSLATQYGESRDCTSPLVGDGQDPRHVVVTLNPANVRTVVLSSDGTANRWGYVRAVQGADEVASTGLNDDGRLALYLPDGTYDLEFYPGPTAKGSPTTVTMVVSGVVSDLPSSVTLGSGNVSGSVARADGSPVEGAFVTAVNGAKEVGAVVAADGSFTLDLGGGTWAVRAHDPGTGTSSGSQAVDVTGGTATPSVLTFEVN